MNNTYEFIPLNFQQLSEKEMLEKSNSFFSQMNKRRSVREFSSKTFPIEIIENIIKTASSAPSGANKQPWTFCIISNPEIKKQIRIAAEKEEKESYDSRMSDRWKEDLEPLGTNWEKPFLETVPYIIVVFKKVYEIIDGEKNNNYYVNESVGLSTGFLIVAIHNAGLATLTHTPSPMNFLSKILNRPENERPFLLLPVGFPIENCKVPNIQRKSINDIKILFE